MVSLKNILSHILECHGFGVYEVDGILHGQRDDDMVTIGIYERVTLNDIRQHAEAVSGKEGNHIICVLEAGDAAVEEAREKGLTIWKRSDLEQEIGAAIVNHINQAEEELIFTGLLRSKEYIPDAAMPDISIEEGQPPIVIESVGAESATKILKSHLSLEDVKEIANNTVRGFKHELELVPYYVFNYTCKYHGKDGELVRGEGIIAINALTGKYTGWDHEPDTDPDPGHHIRMEPKIDEENAIRIAIHAVAQLNTEFKEVIVERDHSTIIEKATFKPEEENIKLERQSLVMVPVWCVEGKHGVMILDGITGKVISEDYYDKD